eukprot:1191061-Prymnesium_polylepis.1
MRQSCSVRNEVVTPPFVGLLPHRAPNLAHRAPNHLQLTSTQGRCTRFGHGVPCSCLPTAQLTVDKSAYLLWLVEAPACEADLLQLVAALAQCQSRTTSCSDDADRWLVSRYLLARLQRAQSTENEEASARVEQAALGAALEMQ